MCGRFTLYHPVEEAAARFSAINMIIDYSPRYNIAPTQEVPVVIENGVNRELLMFRWGLIPSWAKDPAIGNRLFNARAETLAEKASFREGAALRRCLIPADGFYEWKRESNEKHPMLIQRKDGELFAFAGIWEEWKAQDGSPVRSCTIITTQPNDLVVEIHNRMPAILKPEDESNWLDRKTTDFQDLQSLLRPYPAENLQAFPVSNRVNTAGSNDLELIIPVRIPVHQTTLNL